MMVDWDSAEGAEGETEPAWEAEGPSEPSETTEPDANPAEEKAGRVEAT